jgi:hypothetical protein
LKEDHTATPLIPSAPLEATYMESYRMVTKPHHALDMFGAQQKHTRFLDTIRISSTHRESSPHQSKQEKKNAILPLPMI